MKIIIKIAAVACVVVMGLMGSQAMAGNGYGTGKGVNAPKIGTGMFVDICAAEDFTVEGTVSEAELYYEQGIKIDDGDAVTTVYGIGPLRYWDSLEEVGRPAVGDNVVIVARKVVFSDGSTKNIAMSITFTETGEAVELRDENCLPIWRGGNGTFKMLNTALFDDMGAVHLSRGGKGKGHGGKGKGRGAGDGTGNGPKDGSGNGSRTGDCPLT